MKKEFSKSRHAVFQNAPWCISGSIASVASTAALALLGLRLERPAAGINGPSQWLFGRVAAHRRSADLRHTATGYLIHHASSLFWSYVFESSTLRAKIGHAAVRAAAVSVLAAAVDYGVVPRRFRPGFEAHFSPRQIAWVYGAFAAGLLLGSHLNETIERRAAYGKVLRNPENNSQKPNRETRVATDRSAAAAQPAVIRR